MANGKAQTAILSHMRLLPILLSNQYQSPEEQDCSQTHTLSIYYCCLIPEHGMDVFCVSLMMELKSPWLQLESSLARSFHCLSMEMV